MTKRLYFTCPIKALYMMKEFEVEFECLSDETVIVDGIEQKDELFYDFADWGVDAEMISDLPELFSSYPQRLYVAPKSEHIFEPKIDDFGINGVGDFCAFTGEQWLIGAGKRFIETQFADIIFRNNKQFFMPEVENN